VSADSEEIIWNLPSRFSSVNLTVKG